MLLSPSLSYELTIIMQEHRQALDSVASVSCCKSNSWTSPQFSASCSRSLCTVRLVSNWWRTGLCRSEHNKLSFSQQAHWGNLGIMERKWKLLCSTLGLYWNNGKENGNYYMVDCMTLRRSKPKAVEDALAKRKSLQHFLDAGASTLVWSQSII